jgi:hypothetical protein
MKDIRPVLAKLKEILESKDKPYDISQNALKLIKDTPLEGTNLGNRFSFIGCWDEGAYYECECSECLNSFEQTRKDSLKLIEQLLTNDWPDSSDTLVATYQKPTAGISLKISVQVSSFKVECSEGDLKEEVRQALLKLNQNQSAQNFLLNVVYVLPTTYKEYILIL